ncbi:glycosyltransferase family 4 protein [Afifella sp. IM 167]|uniref:glycosyltransferase family 4 protein n=1 Tax=Afifella sp. IM 167 TaxID=2033586 RepID=UPI001CCB8D2C|nr:glycosyltransferase family 4 protein [Afifella sp. IM 167]MBZ8133851.1 glycosyltransferase [Afifella sp. IM 167]
MPAQKLKILHVFRAPVGGVFRHVCDLAEMQAAAGHDVGIICDSITGGPFECEKLAEIRKFLSLGLERTPMDRPIRPNDLGAFVRVRAHAAALKPDIIHGHGAKGGVFARLAAVSERRAGRSVATFYTLHAGSLNFDPRSTPGRLYFGVERLLERVTDGLIHVSAFEAATYREKVGVPRCPAHVIHNGLKPEEFRPIEKVGDPADFLYFGELRAAKGVEIFLQALLMLKQAGRPITAHIVGGGKEEAVAASKGFARDNGLEEVSFHTPMPAREAFAKARTIVVPSLAESLPYVVLEAAAGGMPMVATNVGGIPEIFLGEDERLIEPGNVDALVRALQDALDDETRLAAEAAERRLGVRERFSLEGMVEQIERIYFEALNQRRSAVEETRSAA